MEALTFLLLFFCLVEEISGIYLEIRQATNSGGLSPSTFVRRGYHACKLMFWQRRKLSDKVFLQPLLLVQKSISKAETIQSSIMARFSISVVSRLFLTSSLSCLLMRLQCYLCCPSICPRTGRTPQLRFIPQQKVLISLRWYRVPSSMTSARICSIPDSPEVLLSSTLLRLFQIWIKLEYGLSI